MFMVPVVLLMIIGLDCFYLNEIVMFSISFVCLYSYVGPSTVVFLLILTLATFWFLLLSLNFRSILFRFV